MSFPQKTATNSSRWNKYTATLAFIKNDAERQSFFTEECWNHRESCSNYTKNCTNADIHQYHGDGDTRSFCKVFHSFTFSYTTFQAPKAITGYHLASSKQNLVLQKKLAPQSHVHLSPMPVWTKNQVNIVGTLPKTTGLFLRFWTWTFSKAGRTGMLELVQLHLEMLLKCHFVSHRFVALFMCFFWFNWSWCDLFLLWGEEGRKDHKAKLHSESSDLLQSFYFQNSLLLLVSPLLLLLLLLVSESPLLRLLWLLLLAATIIISCQWRPERNPSKSSLQLFGIYGGAIGYKRFDFLVDHSYLIHPSDRDAGHLVRYLSIYSLHDALQLCSRTQLIEPRSGWTLTHMISSFGHGNI